MAREELLDTLENLSEEHRKEVEKLVKRLAERERNERQVNMLLAKASEQSFAEWDNDEDAVYDSM